MLFWLCPLNASASSPFFEWAIGNGASIAHRPTKDQRCAARGLWLGARRPNARGELFDVYRAKHPNRAIEAAIADLLTAAPAVSKRTRLIGARLLKEAVTSQ